MRVNSFALPAVVAAVTASAAIPTIPTLPPGPMTSGIAAASDGTIYFVDSFHHTVWRVLPNGSRTAFVLGRNGRSLQLDECGNLYGTHEDTRGRLILWRADAHGVVTDVARLDMPEQFGHVFVIDDGELIGVAGSGKRTGVRVWRAGEHEPQLVAGGDWGHRDGWASEARFFPIGGMTRTAAGELLVTSGPTIRRISHAGRVTTVSSREKLLKPRNSLIARLIGDVRPHLTGIAVSENGDIYVANAARDAVIRIDTNGLAEEVITAESGWTPTGVSTARGYVYVLEYGNGVRVRRIGSSGVATVVAQVKLERAVAASTTGHDGRPQG